ncbi:RTA1 like protein-domain-containing protein [Aspergillus pseudonomiae]|uniref:RTA1 like protein-domain-containing protein n=1 Tax=Aspergillus pseudonomiae TaxID=1506151 RepID=A0A5N7D6R7_9EURO|nr:RTA1 like protein-domain-containing protein [Aspergillus pseudonomiae]KAB8262162.1 RTA1 like protein-domain-containing protein [Aspergillus pseudonomiae]KAE8401593.1 RTA1 like protein-domain-containing protein [Aspergillus pseudonomiae]
MEFTFYYYTPSGVAGGIFVALFALSTLLHFYQLLRTRTWFMIPFAIGGILETIGYVGRVLSTNEAPNYTKGPYIMQSALILIAPAFLAASIYMTLGRIITMLQAEQYSVIPLRWLTKIFVAGDVLSFLMQASGAGLMVSADDPSTGEHVIIGGLFVQIIFFGFFVITAIVFELRMAKKHISASPEAGRIWRRHMVALYVTSVLILVRSVVRVVEYLDGYDGFLMKHEVFIYVFDALLMFLAMAVLNYIHPSQVNCLLDRGEQYFEKFVVSRKYGPSATHEMQVNSQV